MLMICMLHTLGQGGILNNVKDYTPAGEIFWFMEIACFGAVNIYALISGYVGQSGKVKYSNIISLWLQVAFYTVTITVISVAVGWVEPGVDVFLRAAFPVFFSQYWYFTAYFCMFFFIPLMNFLINSAPRKTLVFAFSAVMVLFSVGDSIMQHSAYGLGNGYTVLWISVMYMVGAYIHKYHKNDKPKPLMWLLVYLGSTLITLASRYLIHALRGVGYTFFGEKFLVKYISPTIVLAAVALFNLFRTLKVGGVASKIIGAISPMTFGVYIIHEHVILNKHVLANRCVPFLENPLAVSVIFVLLTALAIYVLCSVIDFLRIQLFKLIRVKKFSAWLEKALAGLIEKIAESFGICREE